MAYEWIKNTYSFQPEIGRRVKHTVTQGEGVIAKPSSETNYVQVKFDGKKHAMPCHPGELTYI